MVAVWKVVAALPFIAGLVSAQTIPKCAQTCALTAAGDTNCASDLKCLCNSQAFYNSAGACVLKSCNAADTKTAEQVLKAGCAQYVTKTYTYPGGAGASTSTKAAASTSSKAAASTSSKAAASSTSKASVSSKASTSKAGGAGSTTVPTGASSAPATITSATDSSAPTTQSVISSFSTIANSTSTVPVNFTISNTDSSTSLDTSLPSSTSNAATANTLTPLGFNGPAAAAILGSLVMGAYAVIV